jgi:hypothetical protein
MKTRFVRNIELGVGALLMGYCLSVSAVPVTIYDNSVNDLLKRFNPGTAEVGDEILLAGSARQLTYFSFEYYGLATRSTFAGNVQAEVRFYVNNGALFNGYPQPNGSSFYDSGLFSVPAPTDRSTFIFNAGADFPAAGLFIPANDITWSVQFTGMGAGDEVGVDLYSPPVVGSDYPDYWEKNAGPGWTLKQQLSGVPSDFAALMRAESVPDATGFEIVVISTLGLLLFGALGQNKARLAFKKA